MKKKIILKKYWVPFISLLFILFLLVVGSVNAAEFPKGESIPADVTINDDVFITGQNIVIDGTINGNLFASGETVILNGKVSGDALLMAEYVVVGQSALVEGNLFSAGADITVQGMVQGSIFSGSATMLFKDGAMTKGNLYFGGFNIKTDQGSRVEKDLYAGVYQANIAGSIDRNLAVGAAAVELDGSIGRDARLDVGQVDLNADSNDWMRFNPYLRNYVSSTIQPGIRLGPDAKIGGNLIYSSSISQIEGIDEAVSGTVVYQTPAPDVAHKYGDEIKPFRRVSPAGLILRTSLINVARNFIKLMAIGALLLWLVLRQFSHLIASTWQAPLKALGWGFILLAVGFLAMFIVPLVFVLIGFLIGFLSIGSLLYVWFGLTGTALLLVFMIFFFVVFTISKIVSAYMLGKWMLNDLFKMEKENTWLNLLLGVFIFVIIQSLPVIGWLAGLAAILIGSGAFWLAFMQKKE